MSNLPDFTPHGYQIVEQLGQNSGRITYRAIKLDNQQSVVIKAFSLDLSYFSTYEREIEVLRSLNHPKIPRYLDALETPTGFCLVQEYINARPLSARRSYEPDEIKQIATSVLEILVYLQSLNPPIIHRDIKPENILIDEQNNVYLIDFGFAREGDGSVTGSSAIAGTYCFMPPEQIHGLPLTKASDLYSLGATLICLTTGIRSTEINTLLDLGTNRLVFQHRVSGLSFLFIQWLEKMVNPDPKQRYSNARLALEALEPLYLTRLPEVQLSQSTFDFRATRKGERLTQTITVSNPIPDTLLQGKWEVKPHNNDPAHTPDSHAWISFSSREFRGNEIQCKITVDTSKLQTDTVYDRWILLHTNSTPETYTLRVRVQTAPRSVPVEIQKMPYGSFLWLFGASFVTVALAERMAQVWFKDEFAALLGNLITFNSIIGLIWGLFLIIVGGFISFLIGAGIGWLLAALFGIIDDNHKNNVITFSGLLGILPGCALVYYFLQDDSSRSLLKAFGITGSIFIFVIGISIIILASIDAVKISIERGTKRVSAILLTRLTAAFGISLGLGLWLSFSNPFLRVALAATGLPVAKMLIQLAIKRHKLIAESKQQEEHLIKP